MKERCFIMQKSTIKKVLLIILTLGLMMGFVSCTNNQTVTDTPIESSIEYTLHPNSPQDMDPAIENKIREDFLIYAKTVRWQEHSDIQNRKFEDVYINHYFGSFDFGSVLFMNKIVLSLAVMECEIVDGYTFEFTNSNPYFIYHNSTFYEINEAREAGIITKEDVGEIYYAIQSYWEYQNQYYTQDE